MSQNIPNMNSNKNRFGILINETVYYLNKSKSKCLSVGYSLERSYEPVIKLSGYKNNQTVIFNEDEWLSFLNNQGIMLSFIYSKNSGWLPLKGNGFVIDFVFIGEARIIKIGQPGGYEIFLAGDTINEIVNMVNLVKYRFDLLKFQEFSNYYNILLNGVSKTTGDVINNVYDIIAPSKNQNSINICTVMEILNFYPEFLMEDVELCACNEFVKNCFEK